LEQANVLERPREAETCDVLGWQLADIAAVEQDASTAQLEQAGDHVDDRGLACAVRADQPGDPARRNSHGQVLDRLHAEAMPRHAVELKLGHRRSPSCAAPSSWQ